MTKNLVIVESPAKARTINRYLGDDYEVVASVGHVRDLPAKTMSVDIENGFLPEYEIMPGKKTLIQTLKKLANKSDTVYLATDPDREGEAISWHIMEAISTKTSAKRVIFHEITEQGVKEAFENPTDINLDLVNAQQARRILDRVVGYQLSPLLWKKIANGFMLRISAGRVQSIALKLIVDRQDEIDNFTSKEYWNLSAALSMEDSTDKTRFHARMAGSKKYSSEEAIRIEGDLRLCNFKVSKITTKTSKSKPPAPFTTSTLQQESSRKIRGLTVARTMRVAQQLYEGIAIGPDGETGLITYMRTDSTTLSSTAIADINRYIKDNHGENYIGSGARRSRKKTAVAAQEAHEAIRPTSIFRTPRQLQRYLSDDQLALYTLIWKRALASRMADSQSKITTIDIAATSPEASHGLLCSGSEPVFDGYTSIYKGDDQTNNLDQESLDDDLEDTSEESQTFVSLPTLSEGDKLHLLDIKSEQKFTRPSPSYTQATFVKTLEESGIGRPSTYASIMSTLEGRNYCSIENGKYKPEILGRVVVEQLTPFFPDIMDVTFTAKMETNLDEIANGQKDWQSVLQEFYQPYREKFLVAETSMPKKTVQKLTDESCPECERPLAEKVSRNGKFIACTGFPECRYSKPYLVHTGVKCPNAKMEI